MRISDDPLHPAATPRAMRGATTTSTNTATRAATPAATRLAAPTASPSAPTKTPRDSSVHTVAKTLAILEVVAERGSATAKEVSEALGFPLPTAYRLLHALVHADYLVHVRDERRFELGRKLHALGAMASAPTPRPAAG
ncbi:IclR-like helix-turn-helix domain-containing protein [Curtobacterium sp. PhB130]|uniref:helix-turn-helix domain-containing protein n=1 Tax=Curtobacterium sp. PhB130 TaxID=2485178 RepID=UPI000F4C9452|nr:helix-turn-helix domain-containing protein [Curtobacterium sp. PhB130]ROS72224.1 IclR-like helix-turn-helix domain-containing protein [Curtobacterium sp. PhB130]